MTTFWRISPCQKPVFRTKLTSCVVRGRGCQESTEDCSDQRNFPSGMNQNCWRDFNSTISLNVALFNVNSQQILSANYSLSTKYGLIQGKIKKYYGLNSELFSGLFEGHYGSGTAIVSVSPGTGSIHANILFKGIAKEGEEKVKFIVRFHTRGRGTDTGPELSVEESVVLDSVSSVSAAAGGGPAVSAKIMPINAHETCLVRGVSRRTINP